jgi:DNA mismatch repair protein MutS2
MDFSLEPLEYHRLKQLVKPYIQSPEGKALLDRLEPTTDRGGLEARHALNGEAMEYLRDHPLGFSQIPLLSSVLERLGLAGITLTIQEIEAVVELLSEVEAFRTRWSTDLQEFPLLAARARVFPDLKILRLLLGRAVSGGEINEDFSPRLKRLRRDLGAARGRLNRKLESILKSEEFSPQLQEQLVTIRNGRYVIPIRAEQRRRVQGIVHGLSSSGATVFMEPLETLEMNNEIVRLEEEEAREVQRILGELTDRIQASGKELVAAARLRAELDGLFGLARFGRDFNCVTPTFSDGAIRLTAVRHPLLEARLRAVGGHLVPLTIEMGSDERILLISGPNAGGKTVVLKTLGLLALMAQSGMPVPGEAAELPILDHVLADIGDQQSIANQLSTFSAHVLAISSMVEAASESSLILLDEVGSSTEPGEGAALGIAVLEHFRHVGSLTVATTHYNRLKMYAETTRGVRNAAMEFNESTLEPTYRLVDGLAGQSSGLKIAERLRLPPALIERARQSLDSTELDAARYVEELKRRISSLELEKQTFDVERRSFEEWKAGMRVQMENERREELARIEARLDEIVGEMRDAAAGELSAMRGEAQRRFDRSLDHLRARAGAQVEREQRQVAPRDVAPASEHVPASLEAGSSVRVVSLGVEGTVSAVFESEAEVRVGNMKTRRPFRDLEAVEPIAGEPLGRVRFEFAEKHLDSNEINLIGCTREEALDRLDKFLDDAFLAHLPVVRIIHGHGAGTLRRAVAEFLKNHPHVSDFEPSAQNQGGAGVTLARLRE